MKRPTFDQRGIAHLVIVLAVIVLAVIGFGGYYVVKSANKGDKTIDQATTRSIESTQDVQDAAKSLEADQNAADLNPSELDTDLNELL